MAKKRNKKVDWTGSKYGDSHEKFAKENEPFIEACMAAGIEPTSRQASKWRNKKGIAFTKGKHMVKKDV